jgi:hypothetical protein
VGEIKMTRGFILLLALFATGCTAILGAYPGPRADGGDLGTASDGPVDMAGAPSACSTGADLLNCENFELPIPDAGNEQLVAEDGGIVAVDSTNPYRGARSLHVRAGTNPNSDAKLTTWFLPPNHTLTQFWVRAWVQWTQASTDLRVPTLRIFTAHSANLQFSELGSQIFSGMLASTNNFRTYDPASIPMVSSSMPDMMGPLLARTWYCIEWGIDGMGSTLLINGSQVGSTISWDPPGGGMYDRVEVGLTFDNVMPTDGLEAWFDEVVISATQIGCY